MDRIFAPLYEDFGVKWPPDFINRMNNRAQRVFSFDRSLLAGARVLDLGARHGFWSWAAHHLGAAQTIGIEGREESARPNARFLAGLNHEFVIDNVLDVMPLMADMGERFDVVLNLGFFYHIYDHYGLLKHLDAMRPRIIVLDSEIDDLDDPVVRIRKEQTWHPNNAIPDRPGQKFSAVGNPSRGAVELMAECFGYDVDWCDWSDLADPTGCADYAERRRFTCFLTRKT